MPIRDRLPKRSIAPLEKHPIAEDRDRKEPHKPAAAAGAKPAGGSGPGAAPAAAKAELARRGLDSDGDKHAKAPLPPVERAMARLATAFIPLAGAILVLIVIAAGLLAWQLRLMQGQLAAMQASVHQTDQALSAAARTAEAAKKSADAIPDIERAYLLLDASASVLPRIIGAGNPVRVGFKNYGRTPATVHAIGGHYYYAAGPPVRMAQPSSAPPPAQSVGDGATAGPYDIALDATDPDIERARKGDGAVVAQATILYSDLFGEDHETTVCFIFRSQLGTFAPCEGVGLDFHN